MTEPHHEPPLSACVAGLPECIEGSCRHWSGTACTWRPPTPAGRRSRGAVIRLGRSLP